MCCSDCAVRSWIRSPGIHTNRNYGVMILQCVAQMSAHAPLSLSMVLCANGFEEFSTIAAVASLKCPFPLVHVNRNNSFWRPQDLRVPDLWLFLFGKIAHGGTTHISPERTQVRSADVFIKGLDRTYFRKSWSDRRSRYQVMRTVTIFQS